MKNILIILGGGCAAYGMYLWIDGMRKKNGSSDCGCASQGVATSSPTTATSIVVDQDMAPDSERVAYDASAFAPMAAV